MAMRSVITGGFFDKADLSGRILDGSYVGASFNYANLRYARLCGVFTSVSMQGAMLDFAELSGNFTDVDFQGTLVTRETFEQRASVTEVTLGNGEKYTR